MTLRARRATDRRRARALRGACAHVEPASYAIDPTHSFVSFEVAHFGTSTSRGRFERTQGSVWLDRAGRTGRVEISIATASVSTGVAALDSRLRGPECLASEAWPSATSSPSASRSPATRSPQSSGSLSLRGRTLPLTLKASNFNCYLNPLLLRETCGGDFEATLQRSRWGIDCAPHRHPRQRAPARAGRGDPAVGAARCDRPAPALLLCALAAPARAEPVGLHARPDAQLREFRADALRHLDDPRPLRPAERQRHARPRQRERQHRGGIATASVSTGLRVFDARIRERDLLASDEFPQASFVAERFRFDGDRLAEVRGAFTLRGVTQPLSLFARHFACEQRALLQREVCGGDFEAEISRSAFGAGFGLPFVGDRVRLLVQVEGIRQ